MQSAFSDDSWRQEAEQRIEEIRKVDVTLRVVDAEGHPVSGAAVRVAMLRHAFPWGACVPAERILGNSQEDQRYRAELLAMFNCAVLENDLKWNAWHGAYGPSFTRERTLSALQWLKEQGFYVRGHCLVWPGWENLQPWGESLREDPPQLRQRILDHIEELAKFTRDYVHEWDVLNEPVHQTAALQTLGDSAAVEWFVRARAALPEACRLFVNEYNIVESTLPAEQNAYADIIRALLDAGAPVEGIGFQSHFHDPPESPAEALRVFDRFAGFGLPIMVTEFDVNTKDEDRQARFTRDFLTAAFSHPSCSGFVFWGFWEGSHWRPDAALFRKDWSEKPNLRAYRDLVHQEWWTDEKGNTDENGEISLRAFKGAYRIVVGDQEMTADIVDSPTRVEMTMQDAR